MQFTPRKGTETLHGNILLINNFIDAIYAPQGDGNHPRLTFCATAQRMQFTPREGTETSSCTGMMFSVIDAIYAPRGDGNFWLQRHMYLITCGCNLRPARGRKRACPVLCCLEFTGCNLRPARGRKQQKIFLAVGERLDAIYAPRGDGN